MANARPTRMTPQMMVLVRDPEAMAFQNRPSRSASSFSLRCFRSSAFMRQLPGRWGRRDPSVRKCRGKDRRAGGAGQRDWSALGLPWGGADDEAEWLHQGGEAVAGGGRLGRIDLGLGDGRVPEPLP